MHDARPIGQRNVTVVHHIIRFFLKGTQSITEKRFVLQPFVIFARLFLDEREFFKELFRQRFGKNVTGAVRFDLHVRFFGIHTECNVGRKRPRRRRPCKNIGILSALDPKPRNGGSFLYVFIALRNLVRGKSRPAARAVRHDFMPLIKQPFLMDLRNRPPHRFDIIVVIGNVRAIHIDPIAHAVAHLFPFALIFPDGFFTLRNKRLDPVFFDILFAVHPERFFHFEFHGKSVRIPTRLTQNVLAFHRLKAGHDVFHDAR